MSNGQDVLYFCITNKYKCHEVDISYFLQGKSNEKHVMSKIRITMVKH